MSNRRPSGTAKRAKSKPVSLHPEQVHFVEKRAGNVGGVSRYFQMLVEYDRKNDIISAKRPAKKI